MNQKGTMMAKQGNSILSNNRKSLRAVSHPLCSVLMNVYLQKKRVMDILEKVQCRTTKMMKGQEYLSHKGSLKELGQFSLEMRRFRGWQ